MSRFYSSSGSSPSAIRALWVWFHQRTWIWVVLCLIWGLSPKGSPCFCCVCSRFPAHRRLRLRARRREDRDAARGAGRVARARRLRSRSARCHRCPYPLGARRRSRRDRLRSDHRQARRDQRRRLRRDVHFGHRPRAVDLRLPHGGGRGRRVLHRARGPGARCRALRWPPDQEMGGAGRARWQPRSISCSPAPRSRPSAPSS